MNREIRFFDYEQCYRYYSKGIECVRPKRINGETILAKPVFLVAIIDSVEADVFMNNKFVLNEWIEERYKKLMEHFKKSSQFDGTTGIEKPFWHLETDGFWHLNYPGEQLCKSHTPSKAWLKDNVDAYLDESLWIMLQNKVWRTKLRDFIIEQKLT